VVPSARLVRPPAQAPAAPAVVDRALGRLVGWTPVQAHRRPSYRFALGRQAVLGLAPGRGATGLLAAHLGLPGCQPGGLLGLDPAALAVRQGPAAQVHQVHYEQRRGHREADPEAGADGEHTDQLDDVEQQQGREDAAAADHRGGVPAGRRTADRALAGDQPEAALLLGHGTR
jgi:hypothetical protein